MRLLLHLSPNLEPVPLNYQDLLTPALHRWLGPNHVHDDLSLYSFGWLRGDYSRRTAQGLTFPAGARWWLSFYDPALAKAALEGILRDPLVAWGMRVYEAQEVATPAFGEVQRFNADSPILARAVRDDRSRAYLLYDDPRADAALTRILRKKLAAAGLDGAHLEATVTFDRSYPRPKTKLITYKATHHRANLCPVVVQGTPEAVAFAWTVGVGDLTGCGFGGLN